MKTTKAWARVGVTFRFTDDEIQAIKSSDPIAQRNAVLSALRSARVEFDGDSYFPGNINTGDDGPFFDDQEFDAGLIVIRKDITRYELWNAWDSIPCTPDVYQTVKEAADAKDVFMLRFEGQGFYRDGKGDHISLDLIRDYITIVPIGFTHLPFQESIPWTETEEYMVVEDRVYVRELE